MSVTMLSNATTSRESSLGADNGVNMDSKSAGSSKRKSVPTAAAASSSSSSSSASSASISSASGSSLHRKRSSSSSLVRSQYALVLVLTPLNGTFEKKSLVVPFAPEVLKLGRQTNAKTVPTSDNGYFDSRVLSRQHAEVWADSAGKLWIKDAKSSNGTYINSERLSNDNTESAPHELKKNDILEFGIDISNDDGSALIHRKISARVDRISVMSLTSSDTSVGGNTKSKRGDTNLNGSANGNVTLRHGGPSLTTNKKGFGSAKPDSLDVALFGDVDTSLEELVMNHARNSLGGMFVNTGMASTAFENTVKRLIGEIHAAKIESAKINSVSRLLEQISKSQTHSVNIKSLTDQLSEKDVYIRQLEDRLHKQEEQQKSEELERRLDEMSKELKYANSQVDQFSERADAAEQMAMKSSQTISELVKALEEARNPQEENKETKATNTEPGEEWETDNEHVQTKEHHHNHHHRHSPYQHQHHQKPANYKSSSVLIPVTAAGVVLLGYSVMTLINSYARD